MKKARWLILFLTVIICFAVYINWDNVSKTFKNNEDDAKETVSDGENNLSDSYFDNARYTRSTTRNEAIAALKTVAADTSVDEDVRTEASKDINNYTIAAEKESKIESLIKAKGFGENIAFVGTDNASVVVSVGAEGIKAAEAAQIIDIVVAETGLKAGVIKVIEYKDQENS